MSKSETSFTQDNNKNNCKVYSMFASAEENRNKKTYRDK